MNINPLVVAASALFAIIVPATALANATARAYLADERIPGQVQPPFIVGPINTTAQVGAPTDAGYAFAFADLNNGILRVAGKSLYAPPFTTTTEGSAGINDTVTFASGTGLTGFLDYSFDGTLGVVNDGILKSAFAQLFVNIGTAGGSSSVYQTLSAYSANCGFGTNCEVGTSTFRTGTLAFQIFVGAPTSFNISLNGNASIGNSFDFGNTARIYLRLPTGVTYTSSSGTFLASALPITPVPEPATPVLLLVGAAVLAYTVRRRAL